MILWAECALTQAGWQEKVRIDIAEGRVAAVTPDAAPEGARHALLLPAPANLHSHAFQRAMAGLTERRGPDPADSFWTWRRLMYRFLEQLTPEDVEAIAAFVQMEMLEAGYAASVEFHYLHHAPGGRAYDDPAEMSARIAAAAARSGIGLTLLPVYYQYGGCDRRPLVAGQNRFGNEPAAFARLLEGARAAMAVLPADARTGIAPHSLRAVDPEGLAEVLPLGAGGPIHIHAAEQVAEVAEVEAHLGARPVDWLLDNAGIGHEWCLIHCTQMLPRETERLAASGAVAGLCPITESSLGDGIFDGWRYAAAGGLFGMGSDSNIRISLTEELRTLEYSQRLARRARAVLAAPDRSTGRVLWDGAVAGGARAAGRGRGGIAVGEWADLVAVDTQATALWGRSRDTVIDSMIFAGDDRLVTDVWSAGRHLVGQGRHRDHDAITGRYRQAISRLEDRL